MQHGHDSMEAMKRLLSLVLCAIQVIAFVLGGALLSEGPAGAAGWPDSGSAIVTGGVVPADPSASFDSRMERAARARRLRNERGSGDPPIALYAPETASPLGPASIVGRLDLPPITAERRAPPSLVNGPRGPPSAR